MRLSFMGTVIGAFILTFTHFYLCAIGHCGFRRIGAEFYGQSCRARLSYYARVALHVIMCAGCAVCMCLAGGLTEVRRALLARRVSAAKCVSRSR